MDLRSPVAIANYFIEKKNSESKQGLTLMQLLKLSYVAHGFNLAFYDKPLANELVQAWRHGPVFQSIYSAFKHDPKATKGITDYAKDIDPSGQNRLTPVIEKFNQEEEKVLNMVYEVYGNHSGWRLSEMTHKEDTPWKKAYKPNIRGITIDDKEIKEHFEQIVKCTSE